MKERLSFVLGTFGATLLALATIPPEMALANFSGWIRLLTGVATSPETTRWISIGGLILGATSFTAALYQAVLARRAIESAHRAAEAALRAAVLEEMRKPAPTNGP